MSMSMTTTMLYNLIVPYMKTKNIIILAALAALLGYGLWNNYQPRRTPTGQSLLVALNPATLADLQRDFNANSDIPRVLLLVSPT